MDSRPNVGGTASTGTGDSTSVTVKLYAGGQASGAPVQTLVTTRRSSGTYSVRASSLASGTYTVQAEQTSSNGGVGTSPARTFTVDAEAAPRLIVAGDIAGCDTYGDEETVLLLDRLAGTVAIMGDLAYQSGTDAEFADCYDPTWGRHRARTTPAVGDHEYLTPGAAGYFNYFGAAAGERGKGYYSYTLGGWQVIVLNSVCEQVGGCYAGSPQEQWLRSELAASSAACTVAVMHHPRFSSGKIHGSQPQMTDFWKALYEGGADLVVSGHEHVYERFAPQTPTGTLDNQRGVRQFTVGTGGRLLYGFGSVQPNSEARFSGAFGVLQLTLRAGAYDWTFVPQAGSSYSDTGTGACH